MNERQIKTWARKNGLRFSLHYNEHGALEQVHIHGVTVEQADEFLAAHPSKWNDREFEGTRYRRATFGTTDTVLYSPLAAKAVA